MVLAALGRLPLLVCKGSSACQKCAVLGGESQTLSDMALEQAAQARKHAHGNDHPRYCMEYKSEQACKRAAIHTLMHSGLFFKYVPGLVAVPVVQVRPA